MTQTVGLGGTLTLTAIFRDGTGTAVVPVGPTIEVLDALGTQIVAPVTPARNPSTGNYEHDVTIAEDAELGTWTARWSGTINGVAVSDDDAFTVSAAGGLGFGDTRLAEVADLEARMGTVDATKGAAALDDISALVAAESGCDWDATSVPAAVKVVVLTAARRALENPQGVTSETVGSYSYALDASRATGVFLTASERKLIGRFGCRNSSGLASLGLYRQHVNEFRDPFPVAL